MDSRRLRVILAVVAAVAVLIVVVLILAVVVPALRSKDSPMADVATTPSRSTSATSPSSGTPATSREPRPESQDASCPDVMLVSIPGTWESARTDDPLRPVQYPNALLLGVTRPINDQFDQARAQTYTVPYIAEFSNPFANDNQVDYDVSRAEGFAATVKAMTDMNNRCPLTSYVIVGFSQGAVIAGDIASDIGNGRGPVDEDLVLGVTAIADGRRETGVGRDVGPNPAGHGAEVTLGEVSILKRFGLTMTGPRPGGFGTLNDRVNEICASGDLICAAPDEAFNITNLPKTIEILTGGAGSPVHAMYGTTQVWNVDGQSAVQWTLNWARGLVENAPRPKRG